MVLRFAPVARLERDPRRGRADHARIACRSERVREGISRFGEATLPGQRQRMAGARRDGRPIDRERVAKALLRGGELPRSERGIAVAEQRGEKTP